MVGWPPVISGANSWSGSAYELQTTYLALFGKWGHNRVMKRHAKILVIASVLILVAFVGALYYSADFSDSVPIPRSQEAIIPESPPDELHIVSYNVFLRPLPISQSDYTTERAERIGEWLKSADVDIHQIWRTAIESKRNSTSTAGN
jgi:hypothetical protein